MSRQVVTTKDVDQKEVDAVFDALKAQEEKDGFNDYIESAIQMYDIEVTTPNRTLIDIIDCCIRIAHSPLYDVDNIELGVRTAVDKALKGLRYSEEEEEVTMEEYNGKLT